MKKNDVIFLLSALAFSVLFYKQYAGLNFLFFTIFIVSLLLLFNLERKTDKQWWYYALLAVLCGTMVVCINSALSIFANIISLIVLAGRTTNKHNSLIIAFLFSVLSLIGAFVYWLIDLTSIDKKTNQLERKKNRKLFLGIFISIIMAMVFFFLYREASPLFKEFTNYINFDWLSMGWLLFTFWGFLIVYALIKNRRVEFIASLDKEHLNDIIPESLSAESEKNNIGSIIALSLFILLNIMLLTINIFDVNNIFISKALPKGITLSNFVHQSIWSLVASIIIGSFIIMWFFKGELNFSFYGRKVKLFVYAWIIQSAVMVIHTIIRNSWYIKEYQLTYLRIGVYIFLFLSLIGLINTFIKLLYKKSGWYLIARNIEIWFLLLCLSSGLNWDKIITNYNIEHTVGKKSLDHLYITSLSDANIPELVKLYNLRDTTILIKNDYDGYSGLVSKLVTVSEKLKERTWQNYNLRDEENRKALQTVKLKHE